QLANEGTELLYRDNPNRAAALEKFNEAAKVEPDLNTIYLYRRILYADIGLWDLAAADYAQTFRILTRNHWQTCYEHALLQHYVGNEPGYQAACKEFMRQYGNSSDSDAQVRLLHACCLSSKSVLERADLVRRAETLAASKDHANQRAAAAAAFLRAGDYQRTKEICDEVLVAAVDSPGGIHRLNHAYKAIALHRLNHREEAREEIPKLEVAIDEWTKEMVSGPVGTMPIPWSDWLRTLLWYREAKTLITDSSPPEDPRLVAVRERALEVTQGDVFTYMEAGRKAVERQAWDEAAAGFATALEKLPLSVGPGPVMEQFTVEMVQQPEVFERLV